MRRWYFSLCMGGDWSAGWFETKQNCAPSWTYLRDYTGMHGQQNIRYGVCLTGR